MGFIRLTPLPATVINSGQIMYRINYLKALKCWNSSTLSTSCEELTHWKRLWFWEGLGAGGAGTTEDEMAGWHYWLDGRDSEWTPGADDGQGGLVCCDSWGRKESDMTERLKWTELKLLLARHGNRESFFSQILLPALTAWLNSSCAEGLTLFIYCGFYFFNLDFLTFYFIWNYSWFTMLC